MNGIADTLSRCRLGEDDGDGLSVIEKHVKNKDFVRAFRVIKTQREVFEDLSWHKKVANTLTQAFSESDAGWKQNEKEAVLAILEHFMPWLNKAPAEFSSLSVFLLLFHANKRILRTPGMWDYQLQNRLLDHICNIKFPDTEDFDQRLRSFRNTMYAVTWNHMRDQFKTLSSYLKLEMIVMSCRWIIFDSMENISKVGKKFSSTIASSSISSQNDSNFDQLLLRLLTDIIKDCGVTFGKEFGEGSTNLGDISDKCAPSQALVELTFGCLMMAQRSNDFTIAADVVDQLSELCFEYFDNNFVRVLEMQARIVIQLFDEIYGKRHSGSAAQKLVLLRTTYMPKLHSRTGSGEVISNMLTCFFQAIVITPPWCPEKRCEEMTGSTVAKLVSELVAFIPEENFIRLSKTVNQQVRITPEVLVNYINFIIRLVADKLTQGEAYTAKMMNPIQKCMDSLQEILPQVGSVGDCTDLNNQIGHAFYTLANALQKTGRYTESLDICKKCVESFISLPKEKLSMHPHFYCNIMTQTHLKLEDHTEGLEWLAQWLLKYPATLDEHTGPFDLFSLPSCSNEWGAQWVRLKYEAKSSAVQQITVYELLAGVSDSEDIICSALLLEFNAYFTCKYVLGDAIATVGEHLANMGRDAIEKALGHLGVAIGFSWDDKDTHEAACIRSCEYALQILNTAIEEDPDGLDNPQTLIICAIAKAWLAFCYGKRLGTIVRMDFDALREEEKESNPTQSIEDKGNEPDDDRMIPGISSLDLGNEHEYASLLVSCVDSLFTIVSFNECDFKKWIDICPALILLTIRLCACKISALGETFSAIRAWHVCFVLAKVYDRKYIQLVAGLELCKLTSLEALPSPQILDDLTAYGSKEAKHYMPAAFFSRIHLVHATIALKEKQYVAGVEHLVKVLEHRKDKSNLDATHLVLAEAYYLLALYRIAQESHGFSLDAIAERDLAELTPSALVIMAYRICVGIIRAPTPQTSGWQDLCFNQQLMAVMFEHMAKSLEIFKETGNIKELLAYGSDMLFFSQSFGFVSRSLEVLLALTEADLLGRQFELADEKVDAMYRLMSKADITMGVHRVEMSKDAFMKTLKKYTPDAKIQIPYVMPHLKLNLQRPEAPECNIEELGPLAEPKSPTIIARHIQLPKYLFHGISCPCYICLHPKIIPNTIRYFQNLIKVAQITDDLETAVSIVPVIRIHFAKACFRIIFHFERMIQRLTQAFRVKKIGREALERVYLPFFHEPAFHLLYVLAEFPPVSELDFIIDCVQKIEEGLKLTEETDLLHLISPIELMTSALYERFFSDPESPLVRKGDIRTILRQCAKAAGISNDNEPKPSSYGSPEIL